jgi:hypothetical protein
MITLLIVGPDHKPQEMEYDFNPSKKSTKDRVAAFLSFSATYYRHVIRISSTVRDAKKQNQMHIAHMMVYNSFATRTPKYMEPGKRSISWKYLSAITTRWHDENLRDKLVVGKNGERPFGMSTMEGKYEWVVAPDKEASLRKAKQFLISSGVGQQGKAMVACGYKGCVEPCKCGGNPSKHITGEAIDLNSAHVTALTNYLSQNKLNNIDVVLNKFGLHRPLINAKPPEIWHLESL